MKGAEANMRRAGRLNIGPRLMLGFAVIIASMLAADGIILWQFRVVRTQAARLNDIDQKLVAILRVHTSLLAFHDRLAVLAQAEDANGLVMEAQSLREEVLESIRRAVNALSVPPFDARRDPTILPSLRVIQSALPSHLDAIITLARSSDWRAVHLRLANQVRPLATLTSSLVAKVDEEASRQQAQTVENITHVQRLVFLVVPLTAVFTLLIAATLGLMMTRSITQPLARLVDGSKALARGDFQQQLSVSGNDELAHLGRVFNETARRLRDLYATLRSSEDRLRVVIDTIPAHVWSTRPDGSVDFINQRFLGFSGRPLEDMLGRGWDSIVHPDDVTRYAARWQAAVATGEAMEGEVRVQRMDGEYRWLLVRNVPLRDHEGNIIAWYGTAIDIEERHRAEEALRRSEAYLAEAQRLSNIGSFGWNVSTGEIRWSEETFRIFQHDRTIKPTISLILDRVHPEDASRVKHTLERASRTGTDYEHEYRLLMPDRSVKYVHVLARALSDNAERIEFVGAVMDVTERRLADQRLRDAQTNLTRVSRVTTMGELTASLAHEIKQPIAAAVTDAYTCMRWLGRDEPDVAEARDAAGRIIKDVMHASDIISRLRSLFKMGPPQRESLDVNDVVEEMIVLLRSEAGRYSISIDRELAKDLPHVMADRVQLQQVLMNLMLNGIEAMTDRRPPGRLTVKSRGENGHILISVSDMGAGIAADQTDRIFDAFYSTKPQGTGMGLPISRSIIESHGGRLWAVNDSPRGATFCFTLPTNVEAVG